MAPGTPNIRQKTKEKLGKLLVTYIIRIHFLNWQRFLIIQFENAHPVGKWTKDTHRQFTRRSKKYKLN